MKIIDNRTNKSPVVGDLIKTVDGDKTCYFLIADAGGDYVAININGHRSAIGPKVDPRLIINALELTGHEILEIIEKSRVTLTID